jgi:hypothetical protein
MTSERDRNIIDSWGKNASPWTAAVRGGEIESRILVTDQSIVDATVCNFSLFGQEVVESLFAAVPSLLRPGGCFVVQTLHPVVANGDSAYVDGWRDGSWTGFGPDFVDPPPWYFRTVDTWLALFSAYGFGLRETLEPINPKTSKPASIIFVAEALAGKPMHAVGA